MSEKKAPKIINDLVEFFQWWDNPNKEKGKYRSIQQCHIWYQ